MNNQNNYRSITVRMIAGLLAALLILVSGCFTPAYARDDRQTGSEIETITPIGNLDAEPPEVKAKAAMLYSLDLDVPLFSKNENKKISPYSTTKILTAYLALEKLPMDKKVKASKKATQVYEDGSSILLEAGEKMSVKDLVYGTLLASGNDAAYALGEAMEGSEKRFAKLMNKTVKSWGCNDTNFVNANGWKHKDHYTTAHDMCIILRKCMENETLREISMTREYTIPATNKSEKRDLENIFLKSISESQSYLGGKTGRWEDDDCAIVLEFAEEGLQAAIVLLGDTVKGRVSDVDTLMKFSHVVTPGFKVCSEGDTVTQVRVKHGEKTLTDLAVTGMTLAYPRNATADEVQVDLHTEKLEAPIRKGEKVGTYTIYVNGQQLAQHDLLTTEDIETGWFPSYIYISNEQTRKIMPYAAAAVLLVLAVIILSIRNSIRRRKKSKQNDYAEKH